MREVHDPGARHVPLDDEPRDVHPRRCPVQHVAVGGGDGGSGVREHGVGLAWELFDGIPAMTYEEAALTEPTLADDLRDLGLLVYGPTNRLPAAAPIRSKAGGKRTRATGVERGRQAVSRHSPKSAAGAKSRATRKG